MAYIGIISEVVGSIMSLPRQAAAPAAGRKPAPAAPRRGRAAVHPGQSARQPDECLQPVGVHRSQHALGSGAEHARDGGRGHKKGEGEIQRWETEPYRDVC